MPQLTRTQKWGAALAVCVGLLLLRSWFFLAWEESYFDSDQAIVGLMAKHLAHGRARPLFFYGQEYMLAVEAWVAAPFIGLFGTSVAALRTALVAMNLAAGLLLLRLLVVEAGLGVWAALAASSIFWIAPLASGAELLDANGGNIEPFAWVLIAWLLRHRPLALGACLAIAFLNREFSIYAAPALVAVDVYERRREIRSVAMDWLTTGAAFLIVFGVVQRLKPFADLIGPGTAGMPVPTNGQDSAELLLQRVHWNPAEWRERFGDLVTDYVPTILGFKDFRPDIVAIGTDLHVGAHLLTPLAAILALAAVVLFVFEIRGLRWRDGRWLFPFYLIAIAAIAGVGYAIARPLSVYTIRYGLLVLDGPVGVAALLLQSECRVRVRATAMAVIVLFAACSITDYVRILARAPEKPPATPLRDIERRLSARGVEIAFGDYWRAYSVAFLSDERIKVASLDIERIHEYKAIAGRRDAHGGNEGVIIQREPCVGGEKVGGMYLCEWR